MRSWAWRSQRIWSGSIYAERRSQEAFFASYQLYRKYGEDYGLERLLSGEMPEEEQQKKVKMAKEASFEERFLVTGLLLDGLNGGFLTYEKMDGETGAVYQELLHLKAFLQDKRT